MTRITRDQSANPVKSPFSAFQSGTRNSMSSLTPPTSTSTNTASPSPILLQATTHQGPQNKLDPGPSSPSTQRKKSLCPHARLRLHIDDLTHASIPTITGVIPLGTLLSDAILNVQKHLFTTPSNTPRSSTRPPPQRPINPGHEWKPQEVRSVTLILRPMDGVAYTTGTTLDEAHKEIHLSLDYLQAKIKQFYEEDDKTDAVASTSTNTDISLTSSPLVPSTTAINQPEHQNNAPPPSPSKDHKPNKNKDNKAAAAAAFRHELNGVVTHETVHAFQHNARGTCPGGLIEGIADYVRMKSGLGAAHWKPFPANEGSRGKKWDEGYQKTAWFLAWVEDRIAGEGFVGEVNWRMRGCQWEGGKVWEEVVGIRVEECWKRYSEDWERMNKEHGV